MCNMEPITFLKQKSYKIAIVIPCYQVANHILKVIDQIDHTITKIYVIDDKCPQQSGKIVLNKYQHNPKIKVLFHQENQGVGGAILTGYKAAFKDQMDIIVKIDGDGQMDPHLISSFVTPIIQKEADYTKGNRFFYLESLHQMPKSRLFGNAVLSLINKLSSGYWNCFDPTNGYTAIRASLIPYLPIHKISKRYFFETDMLFRLNIIRAVVTDIPMDAKYEDETSHLKITKIIPEFLLKHCTNFIKRIFYNYYLRDLSIASIELPIGLLLFLFGLAFGLVHWRESIISNHVSSSGTVMLAALSVLMGLQLILSFLSIDINSTPKSILQRQSDIQLNHFKDTL